MHNKLSSSNSSLILTSWRTWPVACSPCVGWAGTVAVAVGSSRRVANSSFVDVDVNFHPVIGRNGLHSRGSDDTPSAPSHARARRSDASPTGTVTEGRWEGLRGDFGRETSSSEAGDVPRAD